MFLARWKAEAETDKQTEKKNTKQKTNQQTKWAVEEIQQVLMLQNIKLICI